jgi:iron complex outermembrane receptor protein
MFKRHAVGAAALACLAAATQSAFAQQALERVEITGSSIRRVDAETASPVQVITRQDLAQSGKGTVSEFLQTLTADGQGSVPFTYGRGFSGGTSAGISLRGLGANATLVLINGRRVTTAVLADDAQRSYVDLNQIPFEAVERIDVLKDGASSTYGSDAVAGVVNIILRKNFTGTVAKATFGTSQKSDGNEKRAALTHGFGNLETDGFNLLLNVEVGDKNPIYYRDRAGRGSVGVSAAGANEWGMDPNGTSNNIARFGGNGWILSPGGIRSNNQTTPSLIGNVRNPTTLDYYSRGDANAVGFTRTFSSAQAYCLQHANLVQNNPAGGCLMDARQAFNQIQPEQTTGSFFGRFAKKLGSETEFFTEVGYYQTKSNVVGLPTAPSGAYFTSDGISHSQTADTVLGAAHPDNPYFGTAARLSYLPAYDIGAASTDSKSHTWRGMAGIRTTVGGWDLDAGVNYSEARQTDTSNKLYNWRVKNALLNPTAANVAAATAFSTKYAALPAGTYWRIGENAGLNSAAMYDALLASKSREGYSRQYSVDFKASSELWQMAGGAAAIAVGGEVRREENNLPFYDGLGDYIGLSLTAYGGKRDLYAGFTEIVLPVLKGLELSGALRYDHYSDAGNATTPKVGFKWKPVNALAVRGTYSRGFRAPSSAENSAASVAAFGGATINDTIRAAALAADGVSSATIASLTSGIAPTFVQRGNPNLKPEKSKSFTFGAVWDVTSTLSVNADIWQIKRSGLPVIEDPQLAASAGRLTRDASTKVSANDPGGILNGFVVFQNADQSETAGIDLEVKHRWNIGNGYGKVSSNLTWTHLTRQRVTNEDGTVHDYAGTHGNCDITNCIGSPKDKVSMAATWDMGQWRLGANVNYRGTLENRLEKGEACAQKYLNGSDAPNGCKVASFMTLDLSGGLKLSQNFELTASVANVLDRKPATDWLTYGAIGYYPTDWSGAIGRYYKVSARYQF